MSFVSAAELLLELPDIMLLLPLPLPPPSLPLPLALPGRRLYAATICSIARVAAARSALASAAAAMAWYAEELRRGARTCADAASKTESPLHIGYAASKRGGRHRGFNCRDTCA